MSLYARLGITVAFAWVSYWLPYPVLLVGFPILIVWIASALAR